ncbi:FAD binding domain-containing protein [Aquibacillus albus]|uniref:Xanthine dehydrogenase C subunit n=1 Tax=Aquibacillus albus TaxID=1168171 RepID=A0ABS2MZ93_9BACI|nr:xanthine dehydrogenase family protein subunit M [Aquibacillus albus]MBM7571128.1 xanthine dehydrogenase C subunit [Aquibacillus albus]
MDKTTGNGSRLSHSDPPTTGEEQTSIMVWKPKQVEEAWELKKRFGDDAKYISGGTLLQMQREQGTPFPGHLISLENIQEMNGISKLEDNCSDAYLRVGALTSLAVCKKDPLIQEGWQLLAESISDIASPAVRNRGTIGGNIVYGVGDSIPALLVLDAKVSWFDGTKLQVDSLWSYLKNFASNQHIITSLLLPEKSVSIQEKSWFKKVGRRESFIPSLITIAGYCVCDYDQMVVDIKLAVGGGSHHPQRLKICEDILYGSKITDHLLLEAYEAINAEFHPISDPFVSGEYRRTVAANVIVSELLTMQANR